MLDEPDSAEFNFQLNQKEADEFLNKNPKLEVDVSWLKIRSVFSDVNSDHGANEQKFYAKVTKFELKRVSDKFEASYSVLFNDTSKYAEDDTRGNKKNMSEDFELSASIDTVVACFGDVKDIKKSIDKRDGFYYREQTVFVKIDETALATVPDLALQHMFTEKKSVSNPGAGKSDKGNDFFFFIPFACSF